LVKKTKKTYVLSILTQYMFATSFDLWMSEGALDIFTLVVYFKIKLDA
jgi:hypothetical protein